jgi:hypothetical protein
MKEVKIFLPKEGDAPNPDENPFNFHPVKRFVEAKAPARPSLQQLLKGPNSAEQQQGFMALDTDNLSVGTLAITNGNCRVDFVSAGKKVWDGDLSSVSFSLAVEKTLKQFPTVQSVVISVDGDTNFGSLQ